MSLKIENSTEIITLIVFLFFVIYLLNCKKLKEGLLIKQYTWQELCPAPSPAPSPDTLSGPCDIYNKNIYHNGSLYIHNLESLEKDNGSDINQVEFNASCREKLQGTKCDGDDEILYDILKNYKECSDTKNRTLNQEGTYNFNGNCDKGLFCKTFNKFGIPMSINDKNFGYYGCPPTSTPPPTSV